MRTKNKNIRICWDLYFIIYYLKSNMSIWSNGYKLGDLASSLVDLLRKISIDNQNDRFSKDGVSQWIKKDHVCCLTLGVKF